MENRSIIYSNEGTLMKMDLEHFTISEVKMKSKIKDRNLVVRMAKLSAHGIICYSVDYCLFSIFFQEEKGRQICFVCPFCLQGCFLRQHLTRSHMNSHLGSVNCPICQVRIIIFILNFIFHTKYIMCLIILGFLCRQSRTESSQEVLQIYL